MRASGALALPLALVICLQVSPANAAEGELVVAVEPGYALLHGGPGASPGVGSSLTIWAGVSESLWIFLSIGPFWLPAPKGGKGPALLVDSGGGVVAALDTFRTVPFVEAAIELVAFRSAFTPTVRVGLGADYLITPRMSFGVVARYRPLFDGSSDDGLLTLHIRIGWRTEL